MLLVALFLVWSGATTATEVVDAGLLTAIKAVDEAGVRAALAAGADVTATETDGTTPLHWAVHADDPAIVELGAMLQPLPHLGPADLGGRRIFHQIV